MTKTITKKNKQSSTSKIRYPYKVDFNDHFETPLIAYQDILPLLDALNYYPGKKQQQQQQQQQQQPCSGSSSSSSRAEQILYDPYYCNGRTKQLLQSLGYTNVQHEKRDFYKDIKENTVPYHHILITNPPYSSSHKERCIQFAIHNLQTQSIPFFLLMPNYVALKEYFRNSIIIQNNNKNNSNNNSSSASSSSSVVMVEENNIFYVIPSIPYEYDHPEGKGHETSPFSSLWFCGIPTNQISQVKQSFSSSRNNNNTTTTTTNTRQQRPPTLVSSLMELRRLRAVPTEKRKNPKQRRKEKINKQNHNHHNEIKVDSTDEKISRENYTNTPNNNNNNNNNSNTKKTTTTITITTKISNESKGRKRRKSMYRDDSGMRKRKRF